MLRKGVIVAVVLLLIGFFAAALNKFCGIFSCKDALYLFQETPKMEQFLEDLRKNSGASKVERASICWTDRAYKAYRCRFKIDKNYIVLYQNWNSEKFRLIGIPHYWENGGRDTHLALVMMVCGLSNREDADRALLFIQKEFTSVGQRTPLSFKIRQCGLTLLHREVLLTPDASSWSDGISGPVAVPEF